MSEKKIVKSVFFRINYNVKGTISQKPFRSTIFMCANAANIFCKIEIYYNVNMFQTKSPKMHSNCYNEKKILKRTNIIYGYKKLFAFILKFYSKKEILD